MIADDLIDISCPLKKGHRHHDFTIYSLSCPIMVYTVLSLPKANERAMFGVSLYQPSVPWVPKPRKKDPPPNKRISKKNNSSSPSSNSPRLQKIITNSKKKNSRLSSSLHGKFRLRFPSYLPCFPTPSSELIQNMMVQYVI